MDTSVCRKATLLAITVAFSPIWGQGTAALDWRRIGNTVMDLSLASPAAGPVDRVWYSADGDSLFAKTQSGRVWQTSDFEKWTQATVEPPDRNAGLTVGPDGALVVAHPLQASRMYAAGKFAYRSDDSGLNWTNVTRTGSESILGAVLLDAAVSPRNPEEVVVGGSHGLWRSMDGGESWSGLNDGFPNLPVERILAAPGDGKPVHIVAGDTEFVWAAGERLAWRAAETSLLAAEQELRSAATAALGAPVTAVASSGDIAYAGAADGRLFFSRDRGANWGASGIVAGAGSISRIRIDAKDVNTAVAITESRGRGRVLRTNTAGVFWEDLSGNLPPTALVRGVAFDRASNAIYAATDRGVFFAYTESSVPAWTVLRSGSAWDVALDTDGNQLYAAFEESGLFGALAPHRLRDPRVVSAADRVARAAAPGSLLSVIGAKVNAARIGERNAPVLASTDIESQIQVPFDAAGTNVHLSTDTTAGARQLGLTLLPASPSIFVDPDGVPLVLNAETGLVLDPGAPARSGTRLQILATGLGRVQPEWPTGLAAPIENPPRVMTAVRAYLEREPVEVTRATLAPGYVGMYLVEVQLPALVNRGTAELYIEAQNHQSNRIRIYLEP
ncbi:MAG TPA: hypothetical protein VEX68_21445 [Bryobacteraceae bacterium]|nr:hypothetical protein [Bryobacteraceae bacterium]